MLVLHQLLYVLFTLRGIFIHFLELTYKQDASANSHFLLFFYSKFLPKEIFSELDKTKPEVPNFSVTYTESKADTEEGTEVATPPSGAGPLGRARP
jgi:hypothetical protein